MAGNRQQEKKRPLSELQGGSMSGGPGRLPSYPGGPATTPESGWLNCFCSRTSSDRDTARKASRTPVRVNSEDIPGRKATNVRRCQVQSEHLAGDGGCTLTVIQRQIHHCLGQTQIGTQQTSLILGFPANYTLIWITE